MLELSLRGRDKANKTSLSPCQSAETLLATRTGSDSQHSRRFALRAVVKTRHQPFRKKIDLVIWLLRQVLHHQNGHEALGRSMVVRGRGILGIRIHRLGGDDVKGTSSTRAAACCEGIIEVGILLREGKPVFFHWDWITMIAIRSRFGSALFCSHF